MMETGVKALQSVIEEEDDVISYLKQAKWNRFIDPITVNNYALQ